MVAWSSRLATRLVDPGKIPDDPLAFADAIRGEMGRIRRLAARLVPPAEAEDVVQESLMRAWRHRRSFDPSRGGFASWLFAIVANEARRAGSRRARTIVYPATPPPTPIEQLLDVETAIASLPPRQRLAVDCFYFVGLSVAETAVVMDCSQGTVKSTLSDARGRLRLALEGPVR